MSNDIPSKSDSSNKKNPEIEIKTTGGEKFDVPIEGSLGLLALGYIGLIAWRKKRREAKQIK